MKWQLIWRAACYISRKVGFYNFITWPDTLKFTLLHTITTMLLFFFLLPSLPSAPTCGKHDSPWPDSEPVWLREIFRVRSPGTHAPRHWPPRSHWPSGQQDSWPLDLGIFCRNSLNAVECMVTCLWGKTPESKALRQIKRYLIIIEIQDTFLFLTKLSF